MPENFEERDLSGHPGASDSALPADDLELQNTQGVPTDSLDALRDRELHGVDGAYGEDEQDPAMQAVIEAGGGVSEGFEQSEALLVEHATVDTHGTSEILFDAIDEDGDEEEDDDLYGEGDEEKSAELTEDVADWDDAEDEEDDEDELD
jgi:hypothetical protein